MTTRSSNSADMMRAGLSTWRMLAEAQTVVGLRMLGAAGLWPVATSENARMVDEKGPAFAEAWMASGMAAMRGARPDQVFQAWLRPIRKRTRANSRRLSKPGGKS